MMMKYTGYLHILALIIAIYGTMQQIDAVKTGKPYSTALSISLQDETTKFFFAPIVFKILDKAFSASKLDEKEED